MAKSSTTTILTRIESKLDEIIHTLKVLLDQSRRAAMTKAAYTPAEVAVIVGRRPYTVRNWCRLKRINAKKRTWGQGDKLDWEIGHQELERLRSHGLLPVPKHY